MTILPQHWAFGFRALPAGWLALHAPDLLRRLPDFPRLLREAAEGVGVAEHLLVTRCQLEQSAITYAWDGSSGDYGGGLYGDQTKLKYLCGADRTDSGDRAGGWFGVPQQLLACALRFRYWYRGKDGPRPEWRNWLSLQEDPAYRPGVPVTRGRLTITPDNQASADCLRYTTGLQASLALERLGRMWFAEEYAMKTDRPDVSTWAQAAVQRAIDEGLLTDSGDGVRGKDAATREEVVIMLLRLEDRILRVIGETARAS